MLFAVTVFGNGRMPLYQLSNRSLPDGFSLHGGSTNTVSLWGTGCAVEWVDVPKHHAVKWRNGSTYALDECEQSVSRSRCPLVRIPVATGRDAVEKRDVPAPGSTVVASEPDAVRTRVICSDCRHHGTIFLLSFVQSLKERDSSEDVGVDGRVILKWIQEKYCWRVWNGLIWRR
jgi:hypothetical protein